eukprot:scaffold8823_cov162-Isochrysis_galbana.AAC.1
MNAATAAQSNNSNMSDEWGHDSVQSAKVGTPLGTRCRAINNAGFRGRPAGLRRQAAACPACREAVLRQATACTRPARLLRGPAGLAQAAAYWAGQATACGRVPDPSRPRPAGKGGLRQATAC